MIEYPESFAAEVKAVFSQLDDDGSRIILNALKNGSPMLGQFLEEYSESAGMDLNIVESILVSIQQAVATGDLYRFQNEQSENVKSSLDRLALKRKVTDLYEKWSDIYEKLPVCRRPQQKDGSVMVQ